MQEMRDSTASAHDGEALRNEIRSEGYVLLRGLINSDVTLKVAERMRQVLVEDGWTEQVSGQHLALALPRKTADDYRYWATYGRLLKLEAFNSLGRCPELSEVMTRIAGPRVFGYPAKTARLVFPSSISGKPIPLHRDNRGGPWIQDMFTTWVSLGEVPPELGGVAILRGSQSYAYAAIKEEDGGYTELGGDPIPDDASSDWVTTHFRAGDVVIFHCYTLHKGMPNRANQVRITADYRWQTDEHPIHVSALMPYHYFKYWPQIPGWEPMIEEWGTTRWCSIPESVVPTYSKWLNKHETAVPPSKFVDVVPGAREYWRPATRDDDIYRVSHTLPPRSPKE